jgi:hypothetical protein
MCFCNRIKNRKKIFLTSLLMFFCIVAWIMLRIKFLKLFFTVFVSLLAGCAGSNRPESAVIVETNGQKVIKEKVAAAETPIDDLVIRDSASAVDILNETVTLKDNDVAISAAVFIKRLSIVHDEQTVMNVIRGGAFTGDELISTLCWRWLADNIDVKLNVDTAQKAVLKKLAPEAQVFAFIAFARRGKVPGQLKNAFCTGSFSEEKKIPSFVSGLRGMLQTIDNGPVADALSFVTLRHRKLAFKTGGRLYPGSLEFKNRLAGYFKLPDKYVSGCNDSGIHYKAGRLAQIAELPAWGYSLEMLRNLSVRSTGDLQFTAVRVLGSKAVKPVSGDLAAAAAAMKSKNLKVKVEAAKTYLLLVDRATGK